MRMIIDGDQYNNYDCEMEILEINGIRFYKCQDASISKKGNLHNKYISKYHGMVVATNKKGEIVIEEGFIPCEFDVFGKVKKQVKREIIKNVSSWSGKYKTDMTTINGVSRFCTKIQDVVDIYYYRVIMSGETIRTRKFRAEYINDKIVIEEIKDI